MYLIFRIKCFPGGKNWVIYKNNFLAVVVQPVNNALLPFALLGF